MKLNLWFEFNHQDNNRNRMEGGGMKKVRVLKEMPKNKVGDVIDTKLFPCDLYFFLTTNGYIELVTEEKSLEEKLFEGTDDSLRRKPTRQYQIYAQIAREHYLGVFDKASQEWHCAYPTYEEHTRKALESQ